MKCLIVKYPGFAWASTSCITTSHPNGCSILGYQDLPYPDWTKS